MVAGLWAWLSGIPGPYIAVVIAGMLAFVATAINQYSAYRHRNFLALTMPDTKIINAIFYVVENSTLVRRHDEYIWGAAAELRREAILGNITIWGKRSIRPVSSFEYQFSNVLTIIPADYWKSNYFPPELSMMEHLMQCSISETKYELAGNTTDSDRYIHLMVSIAQLKKIWPQKQSFVRKLFLRYFNLSSSDST